MESKDDRLRRLHSQIEQGKQAQAAQVYLKNLCRQLGSGKQQELLAASPDSLLSIQQYLRALADIRARVEADIATGGAKVRELQKLEEGGG